MTLYRLRRLWSDGVVSDIWTGYSLPKLWQFVYGDGWSGLRGRVWIDAERQPATREDQA
jgi:hypothetical protein